MALADIIIPPQYRLAAKALLVVSVISVAYLSGSHNGTQSERVKWESAEKDKAIKSSAILQAYTQKAIEETEKSISLAQQIEAMSHEHQKEIGIINASINSKLNDSRVLKRQVCRGSGAGAMPKDNGASGFVAEASQDGITPEFREFLLSSFRRGDEAGIYAEIASEWILGLCASGKAICGNGKNAKP